MKPINLSAENLLLFIIILVGGIVRFYGLNGFTYSADEVSALLRTDFNSIGDLFRYGVKENDMHPAGVQLFLFGWTKLFGYGEWIVRLPFVISGIISLFITYKLTRRWFSVSAGLTATALLAGLDYFIIYSEIARPYSFGMLFTLMTALFWARLLERRINPINYLWFALSCLLTMYSHYYGFLVVAIIGLTGFIMIERRRLAAYTITGISIILLYLPHYSITKYQLDRGGLEGWLGKPDKNWLFDYLFTLFNESWPVIMILALLAAIGLVYKIKAPKLSRFHLITLAWFSISFLFGFFYSRMRSPILQPSVMLFSAPFLVMFLGDILAHSKRRDLGLFVPAVCLITATSSTVFENHFFNKTHFGVLQEISENNVAWKEKYKDVTATVNVSSKGYMDFYADHHNLNVDYRLYTIEPGVEDGWDSLYYILSTSQSEYFSFGWSTRANPLITYEMIRMFYPEIVEDNVYENSRVTLFKRNDNFRRTPVTEVIISFDSTDQYLAGNQHLIVKDTLGSSYVKLTPSDPYGTEIKFPLSVLGMTEGQYVAVEANFISGNDNPGKIIFEIERDGQQLEGSWFGRNLKAYNTNPGKWATGVFARIFNPEWKNTDTVKIFYWNDGQADVILDQMVIRTYNIYD